MKDKKSFGRFIAEKRKEKGLTQAEVAGALYVTVTAVSKWERGVTYPDITLISDLCEILEVSEHELIAEGNDSEYRRMKAESEKYRKISDAWFYGLTGAYALVLVVCFICNLAVNKTLSWFFIVLTSLMTAFSLFPSCSRFVKRGKLLAVSGSFLVSLLLLLLTCCIYTRGNWYFIALTALLFAFSVPFLPVFLSVYPVPKAVRRHRAMISLGADFLLLVLLIFAAMNKDMGGFFQGTIIALFCALPVFATAAIISYVKANGWIKASFLCVIWGTFVLFVDAVISLILKEPYSFSLNLADWSLPYLNANIIFVTWLTSFLCGFGLFIVGLVRTRKKGD